MPLRISDPAAAMRVSLWRNGLHDQAVDVFGANLECGTRRVSRIGWTAEKRVQSFRIAANRNWGQASAQLEQLFSQRYVDFGIDRGEKNFQHQVSCQGWESVPGTGISCWLAWPGVGCQVVAATLSGRGRGDGCRVPLRGAFVGSIFDSRPLCGAAAGAVGNGSAWDRHVVSD